MSGTTKGAPTNRKPNEGRIVVSDWGSLPQTPATSGRVLAEQSSATYAGRTKQVRGELTKAPKQVGGIRS